MDDDGMDAEDRARRDRIAGSYTFVPGEVVRLAKPLQIAGKEPHDGQWWSLLPLGTLGVIADVDGWSWPDRDGDYGVNWDHPTADRQQFCSGRCLEAVAPLPETLTPTTIEEWLNA